METDIARRALETTAPFLLSQAQLGRYIWPVDNALLVIAITHANIEPILRSPELNLAYATYDHPPPDDLRRPISVNALAQSLGLPFETIRRQAGRLCRLGVCRTTPRGLIIPQWLLNIPPYRLACEATYAGLGELYDRLTAIGAIDAPDFRQAWPHKPPLRAAGRASVDYLLRMVESAAGSLGDPLGSLAWLQVLALSRADAEGGPLTPVRLARVSKALGSPQETVRRRLNHLVDIGVCSWTREGLVISRAHLDRPEIARLADRNLVHVRRLYAGLAQLCPQIPAADAASAA